MCREFWCGNLTKFSLERPKLRWDDKFKVDVTKTSERTASGAGLFLALQRTFRSSRIREIQGLCTMNFIG